MYPQGVTVVTRPLRKDAERNRLRILEAAQEVFADRGLGASLDDIAHHAGVGVGTVYRRFPDKDALIDALFEQRLEEFTAMALAALDNPDPWEGLTAFLEQAAGMQASDRGLKELLINSPHGRQRITSVRDRITPLVNEVVARAQESGALRADIGHQDLPMINMMLITIADAARDVQPDLWRRYLAIVLDGLRAQPTTPTALPVVHLEDEQLDSVMQCWRPPAR
ncbi:MAG: transcriptional regulator, TetR family [Solirubrobacterales bacterium]|nr:transcriptional regulator, TetR family [Solirubrobacterales bacterium]